MNTFKNKKAQFFAILTVMFTLIILGLILGKLFSSKSAYMELGTAGDRASEINDALGRLSAKNEHLKRLIDLAFAETISNLSNEGGLPQKPCGSYRIGNIMYFGEVPTDCASFENIFDAFDNQLRRSLFDSLAKEKEEITRPKLEEIKVSFSEKDEDFKDYKYISVNFSEKISEPIKSTQYLKDNSIFEEVESLVFTTSIESTNPESINVLTNSIRPIPTDLLCNKTEDSCENYYTNYINSIGIEKLRRFAKLYNLELKSVVITPQNKRGNKPNLACFAVFNSSGPLYDSNCVGGCVLEGIDLEIQYRNSYLPKINILLKEYFPKKCILAKTEPGETGDGALYKNIDPLQSDDFYCWDVNSEDESINEYNSKVETLYKTYFPNGYPNNPEANNYFEAYQFCVPLYDKPKQSTFTLMLNDEMFSGSVFGSFGNYLTLPYQYFKRYNDLKSTVQGLIGSDGISDSISKAITNENPDDYQEFKIVSKEKFESPLESEFYNFVDEFIKTIESPDFECVNPNDLLKLYKESSELKKYDIYMNSTHFYILIGEPGAEDSEILSAPKLNGFSKSVSPSVSPIVQLNYCKTDLLGDSSEDLSYEFVIEPEKDYDVIILSSTSEDTRTLNWYKISENTVCLSDQKFSEQSKLYLAEKYIEQFQSNTEDAGKKAQYESLINLITQLISITNPESDVENFCNYLKAKNFVNVDEKFAECSDIELGDGFKYSFSNTDSILPTDANQLLNLASGEDFFKKLDELKKKECTLYQNWHSLVFIDTTYSFFKEVEIEEGKGTKKQIELVNPTYFVSFFSMGGKSSGSEDIPEDKAKSVSITPLGGAEGVKLTPE